MPKMSKWQNYGGIFVSDNSAAEAIVDATPRRITAFDSTMPTSAQATSDIIDNLIKVTDAGDYDMLGILTLAGGGGTVFEFEVYINAAPTGYKFSRETSGGSDTGSGGMGGILTLAANDEVSIAQRRISGSSTSLTIVNAQLFLKRLV